jgi:acyl dehydratase
MAQDALDFATVKVGDELPELVRGPLSTMHLMRFSAAIENWHRIHYDERFAVEHEGLPGLVVSGSWKQHFVAQMVRSWLVPHGWLAGIGLQFRAPDVVGDTLTAWGRVTALEERGGFGVVRCDVGIRDQHGEESSPGWATAVLPLEDGPVPYPFPGLARLA